MCLMQVQSWAWGMYRRSLTAYPAERVTQTCPMPTRPLPLMARTHEDQHTSPCSPSLPPLFSPPSSSVISHLPHLSSLSPFLHKDTGRRSDVGEKEGWENKITSLSSFTLKRIHLFLPYILFLLFNSFLSLFSSLPGCYAEGQYLSLLHTRLSVTWEEMGVGDQWEEMGERRSKRRGWRRVIARMKCGCFIHPFLVMVQLVFLQKERLKDACGRICT